METLPLPMETSTSSPVKVRWFGPGGCVMEEEGECRVFLGGTLIGQYRAGDAELGARNAVLVALARDPRTHRGHLGRAFGLTDESIRRMVRRAEEEGLVAVVTARRGGSEPKTPPAVRRRLWRKFAEGMKANEAYEQIGRRNGLSISTVKRLRWAWEAEQESAQGSSASASAGRDDVAVAMAGDEAEAQGELTWYPTGSGGDVDATGATVADGAGDAAANAAVGDDPLTTTAMSDCAATTVTTSGAAIAESDHTGDEDREQRGCSVRSGMHVQHVGVWLVLAAAQRLGLYEGIESVGAQWSGGPRKDAMRIAVDAVLAALALGQGCVEGVRRLQTPTATLLLRAHHAPSASWTRSVLHDYSERPTVAALLQMHVTGRLLAEARPRADEPAVFYVDNHLRPYSGKHVVRRGWRMQDKRVRPGATDYYVHDQDGRPLLRFVSPDNQALTGWLGGIAELLTEALPDERVLVAFDRAGAFPEQMAQLRDLGVEFVTYERRPYPLLTSTAFDRVIQIDGEEVGLHESADKNLGGGRGRVRRIALRMSDGAQVNLVACSRESAERLVAVMMGDEDRGGRWVQENGLKHGVERWGINQLDGRSVERYQPDTVIPNPARRRLDRALRLERQREGLILRELALLPTEHARRDKLVVELAGSRAEQKRLELLRPQMPKHAPLCETELADTLVRHRTEYKNVLDALRIVGANVEADLAGELAPHMPRPAEAKKLLANVLAAPGRVSVGRDAIRVALAPAATARERQAIAALLRRVTHDRLTLPGDRGGRRLVFTLQA
jgi:hypothetical protein